MTLSLGLLTGRYCILATDRRITGHARNQIISEEHNKSGTFWTTNGRVAFSFSGLATCRGFNTAKWLTETMTNIGSPDYEIGSVAARLTLAANLEFSTNRNLLSLSVSERLLSIMLIGYRFTDTQYLPIGALISNHQGMGVSVARRDNATTEFALTTVHLNAGGRGRILPIGFTVGLNAESVNRLESEADSLSAVSALNRLVNLVRYASKSPKSRGLIGSQVSTITIYPDPGRNTEARYHSNVSAVEAFAPATIWSLPGHKVGIHEMRIRADEAEAITGPTLNRNARCYCGSGKKFKRCHGAPKPDSAVVVSPVVEPS